MRRAAALLLLAALAFSACKPDDDSNKTPPQTGGGGGGGTTGGGGGDVLIAPENHPATPAAAPARPEIEARYERAIKRMKGKDYDAAYLELAAILSEAPDTETAGKAARDLETVQGQLLNSPTTPAGDILAAPVKFQDQAVSVRGAFRPGGPVGDASEYFFVDAEGGGRLQCRYTRLHADAKRAIATLPTGTKLLLRGYMRTAGADHYLDISLFKIES